MEAHIRDALGGVPLVKRVKGRGLLLGIEIREGRTAREVRDALLAGGIITGTSADPRVLRVLAPLILQEEHADLFIDALKEL